MTKRTLIDIEQRVEGECTIENPCMSDGEQGRGYLGVQWKGRGPLRPLKSRQERGGLGRLGCGGEDRVLVGLQDGKPGCEILGPFTQRYVMRHRPPQNFGSDWVRRPVNCDGPQPASGSLPKAQMNITGQRGLPFA
jgi:hypothetical protein